MRDTRAELVALIEQATLPGLEITPETELREALDDIDRVCSLPLWLENLTGRYPSDADLIRWPSGPAMRCAGLSHKAR